MPKFCLRKQEKLGSIYMCIIHIYNKIHNEIKRRCIKMDIWEKLYKEALSVQKERVISPFIEAGGVAAAILTKKGNIYLGVCIDTAR